MKILVTGGVRSGKSHHAESLLEGRSGVTYVAPGPTAEDDPDPDWAARLEAHRTRRNPTWTTLESADVASAIAQADGPVLVDCLGTWVTRLIDDAHLWEASYDDVLTHVATHLDALSLALASATEVVFVTNEVGLGVIPSHRSGRLFRDVLGTVNRVVAAGCEDVHLVVAGRVLVL